MDGTAFPRITRALISVSDKTRLGEFAAGLAACGVEIYSTGGTRSHLQAEGLVVRDVAEYTGFPEMLDGRVKTLHPRVFAGILCRHDRPEDMATIAQHGIVSFELVVVNLYPFEQTVARAGVRREEAIEQIDIGGPSLVRAAAKNQAFTTIASNPDQYAEILDQVRRHGGTTLELRRRLAAAAFAHTAAYDQAIAAHFAVDAAAGPLPRRLVFSLHRKAELRYGENPHQQAALYELAGGGSPSLVTARQLHGKELSYNNLLDLDAALAIVRDHAAPLAVVLKHNNPCGAATAASLSVAARNALEGDPVSAFGSILGFNRPLDVATADVLVEPQRFIEAVLAPDFEPDALQTLTTRPKWKASVRLIAFGPLSAARSGLDCRSIDGGFLVQTPDSSADDESQWQVVTERPVDPAALADLRFAWAIVRHVKSNAIVLARDGALVGVGAGQMSRVDSVRIAIGKAGERARGAVLASDAFFPFADSIDAAAAAGVRAIIQPGESRRDQEVIAACNQRGLPMIFTGRRHFRH